MYDMIFFNILIVFYFFIYQFSVNEAFPIIRFSSAWCNMKIYTTYFISRAIQFFLKSMKIKLYVQ